VSPLDDHYVKLWTKSEDQDVQIYEMHWVDCNPRGKLTPIVEPIVRDLRHRWWMVRDEFGYMAALKEVDSKMVTLLVQTGKRNVCHSPICQKQIDGSSRIRQAMKSKSDHTPVVRLDPVASSPL